MGRVGCRTCPPAPARSRPPLLCAAGACSHRHAGAAPTPPHPDRAVPAPSHQPIPAARRQAEGIAGVSFRVQHSFAAPRRHVPHPYHRTAWAADEPARHRRERHDGLRVRPQGPRRRQRGPARFGSARPSRAGPRTRSPANLTAPSREPRLSPARVRRPVSRRGVEMLQSTCARGCGARLRIAMISRIGSFTPSAPQEHVSLLVGKETVDRHVYRSLRSRPSPRVTPPAPPFVQRIASCSTIVGIRPQLSAVSRSSCDSSRACSTSA
jgi:hypothetical protein